MVLNFFQLRNYTGFSFQLINSENSSDNYTVAPWETTARGDMWLAQRSDGSRGVTILASCDGAPVRPLLYMWDHDWAIRYRIGGQTVTHAISVNGNKDFSIDVRDTHFTFQCYNGSFSGGQSAVDVSEWKDQITFSFSEVVSDTSTRMKRETDKIRDPTNRERQNVMDLVAQWDYDYLEHGRRQGTLVGNVESLRGWRIDLQDNGAVERRNMHFYNIAVQYGGGDNNVYAHVMVPVGYVIGRRRIRNALLESMRNREVAIIIPPDNAPTSSNSLQHNLLDRIPYTSDEARNSWAIRSLAWLCVIGSRVLR